VEQDFDLGNCFNCGYCYDNINKEDRCFKGHIFEIIGRIR